jgi:hypothetical protein
MNPFNVMVEWVAKLCCNRYFLSHEGVVNISAVEMKWDIPLQYKTQHQRFPTSQTGSTFSLERIQAAQ